MPDGTDIPKLLDKREVAERLTVSQGTVENLVARGEFPKPIKMGGSVRWLESDVAEYVRWKDWKRKHEGQGDPQEPKEAQTDGTQAQIRPKRRAGPDAGLQSS